jgi:hypothetical protein
MVRAVAAMRQSITNFATGFPSRVNVISPPFCERSSTNAGPSSATSI